MSVSGLSENGKLILEKGDVAKIRLETHRRPGGGLIDRHTL